jgi:hypothetical protein
MKRLLLLLTLLFAPAAFAQKDEGWQKVDGSMMAQGETIPASTLVGAAYGFIWVALLVWVASVAARTRRVEEDIEALRQKLKK